MDKQIAELTSFMNKSQGKNAELIPKLKLHFEPEQPKIPPISLQIKSQSEIPIKS